VQQPGGADGQLDEQDPAVGQPITQQLGAPGAVTRGETAVMLAACMLGEAVASRSLRRDEGV
jgi:hypothetical protein